MKIRIYRKDLLAAVNRAAAAANAAGLTSAAVLYAAPGEGLAVVACDYALAVRTRLDCEVEAAGAAMVPAAKLVKIVAAMPDGMIELTHTANGVGVHLQNGRTGFDLEGWDPASAPQPFEELDEGRAPRTVVEGARALIKAMQSAAQYVGDDPNRTVLQNVLVAADKSNGKLRACGTDGTRACMAPTEIEADGIKWALPSTAITALAGAAGPDFEDLLVVTLAGGRQLCWIVGNVDIQVRQNEGDLRYPDVDRLWSDDGATFTIAADAWADAMRRAAVVAVGAGVKLEITPLDVRITCHAQGGHFDTYLDTVKGTARCTLGVNAQFAAAAVKSVADWAGEDKVDVRVTDQFGAIYFTAHAVPRGPRVIVMPYRLEG